jgi:hypothetical protein
VSFFSQCGKKRAIQFLRSGSFHLGFDNELVARFPDGALRRQLLKSVPDRPGIRAVDACLELEFHRGRPFITIASGIVVLHSEVQKPHGSPATLLASCRGTVQLLARANVAWAGEQNQHEAHTDSFKLHPRHVIESRAQLDQPVAMVDIYPEVFGGECGPSTR